MHFIKQIRHSFFILCLLLSPLFCPQIQAVANPSESVLADHITQHDITWTFDKAYPSGQFINGDYWVLGPVIITSISNSLNEARFEVKPGHNGSMLNPEAGGQQGYDSRLSSYNAALNAGLINGAFISSENPLAINKAASLISMVSWLYNSATDKEQGCPRFNGGTKAPRPVTRSGAILTVLDAIPPANSFRPYYCGDDKSIVFTEKDIDTTCLLNLETVAHTPDPVALAKRMQRPWIDHVHEYLGAMVHPSLNLPNYGQEITKNSNNFALMLHLHIPEDQKRLLLIRYLQFGIDCFGITQVGGGWPANGGHGMGRKLPILVAGKIFNNQAMLEISKSKTRFHDDEQTFYVEEIDIERSNSDKWGPDNRAADKLTYEQKHIGMPEWGIRHFLKPYADNRGWRTPYRSINISVLPGTALAASLFGLREAWDHDALFDYTCRFMHEPKIALGKINSTNAPSHFTFNMWQRYAKEHVQAIEWNPDWSAKHAITKAPNKPLKDAGKKKKSAAQLEGDE